MKIREPAALKLFVLKSGRMSAEMIVGKVERRTWNVERRRGHNNLTKLHLTVLLIVERGTKNVERRTAVRTQ